MRRIKSSVPNGGAPLGEFPTIRTLFDAETKDGIEALINRLVAGRTEGVIVSGCEVTGTASNWSIANGWVYLDGELMKLVGDSGFTTGQTVYLEGGTVAEISGTFADGVSRNWVEERTAFVETTQGAGTTTQYISVSFTNQGETLRQAIINANSVNTAAIQNDAVTTAKIASQAVTNSELAADAVTTAKMGDSNSLELNPNLDVFLGASSVAQFGGTFSFDSTTTVPVQLFSIAIPDYRPLHTGRYSCTSGVERFVIEVTTAGAVSVVAKSVSTGTFTIDTSPIMYLTK